MNRYFPERISIKLGIATFLVSAILGGLALVLISYYDLMSEQRSVEQQLDTILTVSLPSARRSVHLYDEALAEEVVVGLLNYPFISDVAIYDEFDAVLVRKQQADPLSKAPSVLQRWLFGGESLQISRDIRLQHVTEGTSINPGKLTLSVDLAVIYAPFWERTLLHLLQIAVLVVLLSCVLMMVFYLMVTKPLSVFAQSFSEIDPVDPGARALVVPASHSKDELGQVAQISNELLQAIGGHINAREQATLELRKKDLRIRQVLSDSPIGISVVNKDNRRVFVNSRYIHMLGAESEEQLLDADVHDSFVYPNDAQRVLSLETFEQGLLEGAQIERKRLDGSPWWCLMDIRRMEFDGEEVAVNYHYDITERVRAEEDNKRLEHRLEQSKRLEMVGTLAGGIAHDFNNILTPILGYAQMAMEDLAADNPLRADLQEIEKAAKRAKKLIQQVLNFSRKRSGTHAEVMLEELVIDGISLIKASMPKTIELDLQLLTPGLKVWGDPSQLDQVLMNLLTNAVDAIGEIPGKLTLALEEFYVDRDFAVNYPQLKTGNYAKLTVADDGCGIGPDIQERIFDPFFTTKELGKGSGVGLATCHRITTDHEGVLSVYSEEGVGSSFSVLLPLYDPVQVNQAEPSDHASYTAASATRPIKRKRIVYVDDDDKNVRFAERLLFRLGYDVNTYTSPHEAFAEIANCPDSLDLLITDRSMPELSGYDLIARVREVLPDLPILLVSGFADGESEQQKALGVSGFISKPFEKDEIAEMLERLLDPADESSTGVVE
ncbi:MAG: ATP-binding protein [Halopseudomonas sp.]